MKCTRCLFVLPSLGGGGAERVVCRLLRYLDRDVLDLHLALVRKTGPFLEQLPPHVTVHDLGAPRVSRSLLPLARTVRRLRPQVVFSTVSHMNVAAALVRPTWPRSTRLVVRETATCDQLWRSARWPRIRKALYRRQYRDADTIVCQSPFMVRDLSHHLGLPVTKMALIPNPIDFRAIDLSANAASPFAEPGPHVVALGRLRPVKGTERLLSAFPRLLRRRPSAQLWFLGDGPLESTLRQQAARTGIARHVHFPGFQSNPYPWLRAADLLAVASRSESSCNALLEAVACGCPPVAARHPGGTYEMLAYLGLEHRYVTRLDRWDESWFQPLASHVRPRAESRYDVARITAQYRGVLEG